MNSGILDIDHLMVCVSDSQAAGDSFERLGFTVTPKSELPGLSNRLICFKTANPAYNNFVELMAWEDREAAPALMNDILTDTEQPVSMVMVSADAHATGEVLAARGFEPYPPMDLQRDWILPDGEVITPRFTVSIPKAGKSPLYWNVCEYKNPDLYQRPEFLGHANGAVRLAGIIAVAKDPATVARHYRNIWDAEPAVSADGAAEDCVTVSPGLVPLILMTPAAIADRYGLEASPTGEAMLVGFIVEVADLDEARAILNGRGIQHRKAGDTAICVGPAGLHGCLLELRQV